MNQNRDIDYIKKILAGEREVYACLVEKYQVMVYNLALGVVKDREEAEEIAQETFVKAYQSLSSFKGQSKFSSWLYRIAYNTAISNIRRKSRNTVSMEDPGVHGELYSEGQQQYDTLSSRERKHFLNLALDSLDPDERTLIVLYYYEDKDIEELAEITRMTKTNTKVRLYRARKKMLLVLQRYLKKETLSLL